MLAPAFLLVPLLCATAPARVELVFGGDVIPHGEVKQAAADNARFLPGEEGGPARSLNHEGWSHVFGPIADVLRTADVAVVNLETPVSGDPRSRTAPFIFDAPPALLRGLAAAGVDVVSLANNHAFDQRRAGIVSTWKHVAEAGLRGIGSGPSEAAAWEPLVLEKRGIRLGFLAFTRLLNGASNPRNPDLAPHVAYVPYGKPGGKGLGPEAAAELVRAAARRCDALIVSIHWGTEYSHTPHPEDRRLAQALLEAGALALIGHHPHVLQPIEPYRTRAGRDTLVAFSLGNLIANQDRRYRHGKQPESEGTKRDSVLLRLSLVRPQPGAPVVLEGLSVLPVWIENNHHLARGKAKVPRHIQPVLLDEELQVINARLLALSARALTAPREGRQERTALERRLDLARRRRERILQMVLPPGASAPGSGRRPALRRPGPRGSTGRAAVDSPPRGPRPRR